MKQKKNSGFYVFTEAEKKLMKEYEDCYSKFIQMLDDNQKEVFEAYRFCLLKREIAAKSEYFTEGFICGIIGLKDRDALFEDMMLD
ncbi:MAG: hypothetical protein IJZ35_02240 [Clostridia bacterium]|nr:hypothetical protein [Clostridia bacterium]